MNNFIGPNNSYNAFRSIIFDKLNKIEDSNIKVGVVLDVDVNGNKLFENSPRNSIVFKLKDDTSQKEDFYFDNADCIAVPIQDYPIRSGELVFIVYFTDKQSQAFWIPLNNIASEYNPAYMTKDSEERIYNDDIENVADDAAIIEYDIPKFKCRMGDRAIEGTNNAMAYISRDRPNTGDSGYKEKAGLYYIVAGRSGEDIDLENDESYIYVCEKTDVDDNLKDDENPQKEVAAEILKTNSLRVIFNDLRFYNKKVKGTIDKEGNIELKLLEEPKSKIKLDKDGNLTFENVKKISVKGANEIKLGQDGKHLVTFEDLQKYTKQLENSISLATYVNTIGVTTPIAYIPTGGLQPIASTKTTKTKISV